MVAIVVDSQVERGFTVGLQERQELDFSVQILESVRFEQLQQYLSLVVCARS